jgi:thiol-disulfide isomerase/thioredoxin
MKKITLCSVLAILCLYATAQSAIIKPLYTGDRLPDIVFTQVLNHTDTKATLSGFQQNNQKLLLLDFWNTTCIPCIKSFKKLDSLQQAFKQELQIVLITPEDSNIVKATLERWQKANNQKLRIPVITNDTLLQRYIHKQYNPHYAWIAPDNVLIAQTSSSFVTAEILKTYLSQMKYDLDRRGYLKRNNQQQR